MKRDGKHVLIDYEEVNILDGDIPELAIIQLGFRRRKMSSYKFDQLTNKKIYIEEDVKDTCDVEIPKNFLWQNFEFILVGVFCHHGPEPSSGHFTNYLKHNDEWYHHNDDICTKCNIDDFLPLVRGGSSQTCCAVVYRTRRL